MLARLLARTEIILTALRGEPRWTVEGAVQLAYLRIALVGGDQGSRPDEHIGASCLTGVCGVGMVKPSEGEVGNSNGERCGAGCELAEHASNSRLVHLGWRAGEGEEESSGGVLACRPDQIIA